jgi:hypothetical protein
MRRRHERVPRPVVDDAGRRELRRLARARARHGHSGGTLLAGLDLNRFATSASAATLPATSLLAASGLPALLLLLLLLLRDESGGAHRNHGADESRLEDFAPHAHSCGMAIHARSRLY